MEQNTKKKRYATCVRLSEEEFLKFKDLAEKLGISIPELLKSTLQKRKLLPCHKEDIQKLLVELSRIGNNVNQIAKRLNSGFRAGFESAELKAIMAQLVWLKDFCRGEVYGDC